MKLVLPWPPSVNHYWRRVGARTLISRHGRKYKLDVAAACIAKRTRPSGERLSVSIVAFPPDRRRRDLDNLFKPVLDSLAGYAYDDDSQIDLLTIERGPTTDGGLIHVTIEEQRNASQET